MIKKLIINYEFYAYIKNLNFYNIFNLFLLYNKIFIFTFNNHSINLLNFILNLIIHLMDNKLADLH
jgi:hypothetical protein